MFHWSNVLVFPVEEPEDLLDAVYHCGAKRSTSSHVYTPDSFSILKRFILLAEILSAKKVCQIEMLFCSVNKRQLLQAQHYRNVEIQVASHRISQVVIIQ
ncbi:hypothetical protein NE237_000011 [Protea cynaroides]|uniref:Uncharacterized protein n=1 Tax=Protea cynaroides TaxID=273540 RepID=A0A9Q0GK29_9MAGN|nr:hypothetical protein NE237_000011 [Protea cynaroides]